MKKDGIRLRVSNIEGTNQIFKALITHPMESGYRRDRNTGKNIPADYIEEVRISIDETLIFEIKMGESVSRNPYVSFTLSERIVNEQVMRVSWSDNHQREIFYDCVIIFGGNEIFGFTGDYKSVEIKPITPKRGPACDLKPTRVTP